MDQKQMLHQKIVLILILMAKVGQVNKVVKIIH
jgi:hypothetical protein